MLQDVVIKRFMDNVLNVTYKLKKITDAISLNANHNIAKDLPHFVVCVSNFYQKTIIILIIKTIIHMAIVNLV